MSLLMPALALAMPAFAQDRDPRLSDSQEPGSVIVFPKFITGTVALPEGGTAPATELEIGIVCPVGVTCPEHQSIKMRFHWVCPGDESFPAKLICRETDFDVTASVNEKVVLVPNGVGTADGVGTRFVPPPPCPKGYLIGWVVNTSDRPIKFDGLIGDAVLRVGSTALASYNAIPIQADPTLANGALITLVDGRLPDSLAFDGGTGHYQAVTGRIYGDVRYTNPAGPTNFAAGYITLLTLDTLSNRPNFPTFVDLFFYAGFGSALGVENVISTSTEFVCWTEQRIDDIDINLRTTVMGRKGVVISGPAEKIQWAGIDDDAGPVTLLGLLEASEGSATAFPLRTYFTSVSNDSVPVPTVFEP
jgi:hypothetical protein